MRLNVVAALTAALVLSGACPAWAHATFRPVTADPGARLDTVLSVPPEPEGTDNTRITMYVATGWTPLECRSPVGWDCAVTTGDVTWTRLAGVAPGEDFDVALTAPRTPGTYAFPVVQEVDDGSVHRWDADARADGPAPQLAVRGAGVTPPPTTTASPHPTASVRTTRTAAPTSTPPASPTALPQASATRSASPGPTVTAVAAPTAVPTARAARVLGRSVATDRGWGAPELLALLLVGVAAAAQVVSRVTRS